MAYIAGGWMDGGLIPDVTKNSALKTYSGTIKTAVAKDAKSVLNVTMKLNQVFTLGQQFVEKSGQVAAQIPTVILDNTEFKQQLQGVYSV